MPSTISDDRPNELLALFTEKDRRLHSKSEDDDSGVVVSGEITAGNLRASQVEARPTDAISPAPDGSKPEVAARMEPALHGNPEKPGLGEVALGELDPSAVLESEEHAFEDEDTEDSYSQKAYDVPVPVMRERLEIIGFSDVLWREELQEYVDQKIAYRVEDVQRRAVGTPERTLPHGAQAEWQPQDRYRTRGHASRPEVTHGSSVELSICRTICRRDGD